MDRMVISIAPDGKVSHTLKDGFFKPDLAARRDCTRMSEVLHNADTDTFYIKFLGGLFKDRELDIYMWSNVMYGGVKPCAGCVLTEVVAGAPYRLEFRTYDEAVNVEIQIINEMRLKGIPVL